MNEQTSSISFGKTIPDAILRRDYTSVPVEPQGFASHACRLVLPRSAKRVTEINPLPAEKGRLGVMAGYQLAEDVLVQVSGTVLPYEVNLVDWLGFETERRGGKLGVVLTAVDENGQVVHADAVAGHGSLQRIVARNNGSNIVVLAGTMPANAAGETKETLGLAAASLDLLNPLRQKLLEPLSRWRDPAGHFQLFHPSSWTARAMRLPRPTLSAVTIKLVSETDTLACLRVECDRSLAPNTEGRSRLCQRLNEELSQAGVVVGGIEPLGELQAMKTFERFAGVCQLPTGEGTVAFAVAPAEVGWFGVVMVCPGKDINPLGWLRAKRAYEIGLATFSAGG